MRLKPDQLAASLQKSLAAVYLISGDEPLQLGEAADDIRQAAKLAGYTTREVIEINDADGWYRLAAEAEALSIFADRKLLDVRLPAAKPGVEGGKILSSYCKNPPPDTLLLISTGKLESAAQKSVWFQAVDQLGVVVQVWPLQGAELLQWLQRRAQRKGMHIEAEALKSLAARIEGNLLAAAQEIEKLYILKGAAPISAAMIEDYVADSSRFDVFVLLDALLSGELNRAVKILEGLRAEGIAAPVVLWAIARETRTLFNIHSQLQHGGQRDAVFKSFQVWDKRKPLVTAALKRLKSPDLAKILQNCALADQQIKGQAAGDGWESLFAICLQIVSPELGLRTKALRL